MQDFVHQQYEPQAANGRTWCKMGTVVCVQTSAHCCTAYMRCSFHRISEPAIQIWFNVKPGLANRALLEAPHINCGITKPSFREELIKKGMYVTCHESSTRRNPSIHPYIHPSIHTYIHKSIYIHSYIQTYIHIDIHTYIHAYIHTYIHNRVHTDLPTHIHTYIHTYIRTYIYTYLHTYLPTYIRAAYIHTCLLTWRERERERERYI